MTKAIFALALLLNFVWEVAQRPAYNVPEQLSRIERLMNCFAAAVLDAFFITGIYFVGRAVLRDRHWISHLNAKRCGAVIGAGAITAIVVERATLGYDLWSYSARMPQLPLLDVGLLPVVQLSLLPVITFLVVKYLYKKQRSL